MRDELKFRELKNEKDLDKKLMGLANLFYENSDNSSIIFHLLLTIAKYDEYRPRVKELLLLLKDKFIKKYVIFELGRLEVQDKNFDMAKKYFYSILEHDPYDKYTLLELGKLEFLLNNFDEAENYFLKIRKSNTKDSALALFWIGKCKMAQTKYDQAEKYFNASLHYAEKFNKKINKSFNEDYVKTCLGSIKRINGDLDSARGYINSIIHYDEKDKFILLEKAKIEKECGNFELSKLYLFKILKYYPNDKYAMYELILLCFKANNFNLAMEYFDKYLSVIQENDPNNIFELLFKMGIEEEQKENFDIAEKLYFDALKYKDSSAIYFRLYKLQLKKGDIQKAEFYLKTGRDKGYNDSILVESGHLEIKKGNYKDSLNYFTQLKTRNLNTYSLIYLITAYCKLNDFETAMEYFKMLTTCKKINDVNTNLLNRIEIFIKYNLGLPIVSDEQNSLLFTKQLFNYNKEFALNHSKDEFDDDVVNSLFSFLQNKISENKPIDSYGSSDFYIFKLDHPVTNLYGESIYYIGATTIMNTDKILYFYPVSKEEIYFKSIKKISRKKIRP